MLACRPVHRPVDLPACRLARLDDRVTERRHPRRFIGRLVLAALPLTLVACGAADDPQLAMCQAVAKQLTGDTIGSWERVEQDDGARSRTVSIAYGTTDSGSGSIDCAFPIDDKGTVATGPNRVRLDGEPVGREALLRAGLNASKDVLAGTAAATAERTRELAGQAGEKAREAAAEAVGNAVEAGEALQERLER